MTSETGRAGCRMTCHSGRATFNTATFHASDVRDAAGPFGCADGATRDSGSHFQANSTLMRTSTAAATPGPRGPRSEEHTSELQSQSNLVCRLLLEKKK